MEMASIKWPLRDKIAIVGVGFGKFGRKSGLTRLEQTQMAFHNALEDSGLKSSDIDGLLVHAGDIQCDQLPGFLGINVRWSGQIWHHGRMAQIAVQVAVMVVNSGMANYCAITSSNVERKMVMGTGPVNVTADRDEAYRPGGGPHQEHPAYGMIHPGCLNTISFSQYLEMYGGNPDNLGYVAVNQRKNAALNPNAVYRTPLTIEDYRKARYIIEPLKLYDFCVNTDGAVCLIITTADRAKDTKNTPVLISGMHGLAAGKEYVESSMSGGLGLARQAIYQDKPEKFTGITYEMAGITQKDIGCFAIYDSFSPRLIFTIEEFGLCKLGEGLDFVAEVDTTYKGKVPINTGGGHLSSGMMNGMSLVAEAVVQARGTAGERQVKNCQYSQCLHNPLSSIIFKRGDR
jgi:acetyl-CoA acetyltransferase